MSYLYICHTYTNIIPIQIQNSTLCHSHTHVIPIQILDQRLERTLQFTPFLHATARRGLDHCCKPADLVGFTPLGGLKKYYLCLALQLWEG